MFGLKLRACRLLHEGKLLCLLETLKTPEGFGTITAVSFHRAESRCELLIFGVTREDKDCGGRGAQHMEQGNVTKRGRKPWLLYSSIMYGLDGGGTVCFYFLLALLS